jgi:hypothetical protein
MFGWDASAAVQNSIRRPEKGFSTASVKSRHSGAHRSLPDYCHWQCQSWSALRGSAHCRTHAPRQTALFDHLVGADEYRGRNGEAERFGSLHVDH